MTPLLEARDIVRRFRLRGGLFAKRRELIAVAGASLAVQERDRIAVVGESGCGKSTLGRVMLGHLPASAGLVLYRGTPLAEIAPSERLRLRGALVAVQQNPASALNPRLKIGGQLIEPLRIQGRPANAGIACAALERVGLNPDFAERYPHQLSGGQRQRVVIARALALEAELIVFDEAVAALDVSVQSQILMLISQIHAEGGLAYLFISHDLRAVRHAADKVAVMYLGQVVELRETVELYARPRHPYTAFLLSAVPDLDPSKRGRKRPRLWGEPPDPVARPSGCAFHPRCPLAIAACRRQVPVLSEIEGGSVACHRAVEFPAGMRMAINEAKAAA